MFYVVNGGKLFFMVRRMERRVMVLLGVLFLLCSPFGCSEGAAQTNLNSTSGLQSGPANSSAHRLWLDEIFYVIIPGKFFNGDKSNDVMVRRYAASKERLEGGYWGGDLAGVIQKLHYLSDLGVTTLFLYPVVQNDRQPFGRWRAGGYRPRDYFSVDENLGDMQILQDLVTKAHERGMRVILDLPLALPGTENPLYNKQNMAKGWFGEMSGYGVPRWNADNPEVADYLIRVSKFWRDQTHCDGFRLDSAVLLSRPFWKRYVREVKAGRPKDFFLMAEVVLAPKQIGQFLRETGFDSGYDFSFLTAQGVFGGGEATERISSMQREARQNYPDCRMMCGELDNYEEKEFIKEALEPQRKRMQLALTFLLTANRIPLLYSGDEAAFSYRATGALFAGSNPNPEIFEYIKRLIALRKQEPALRRGDYQQIQAQDSVCAYLRTQGRDKILVLLNNSDQRQSVHVAVAGANWEDLSLFDLLQQNGVKSKASAAPITLAPFEAAILKIE
jgi:cyclomaltodextrinase